MNKKEGQWKHRSNSKERAFSFIQINQRESKPRTRGYNGNTRSLLHTDWEKLFARYIRNHGRLCGRAEVRRRFIFLDASRRCAISHPVLPRTRRSGFHGRIYRACPHLGTRSCRQIYHECGQIGFDIVEISTGFITVPVDDVLRLIEKVQRAGMKAKPEVGIPFGAGGTTAAADLEAEGTQDVEWAVSRARRYLDAGAYMIMLESEGITESVKSWRTDVPTRFVNSLGLEKVMFEAAEPEVFQWYIKNYGPEVNLFVDHSQIVELEVLRSGLWGTKSLWGRVLTYK